MSGHLRKDDPIYVTDVFDSLFITCFFSPTSCLKAMDEASSTKMPIKRNKEENSQTCHHIAFTGMT